MSELREAVLVAFASGGPLHRADPGFARRGAQLELALAVADAIEQRGSLVAEAGTGIGKTFAYLVPALLSGARVMVSTATKTLQDQLFLRDLPRLRDALGTPVSTAILKGRSSYLCLHRLDAARATAALPDRAAVAALARVERWAPGTPTGDLSEVDGLDERSAVIPLVTSTRDNCLGGECPQFRGCHVMLARRQAMSADVVVVNHHLFFADLTLRDTGVAELLPTVDALIFDEAHQLNETGIQFLGRQLGTAQCLDLGRDLLAAGLQHARGLQPWPDLAGACERAARELRLACAGESAGHRAASRATLRLRWETRATTSPFREALTGVSRAFGAAAAALDTVTELAPDFGKLLERCRAMSSAVDAFLGDPAEHAVRWIDVGPHQARLVESPLDIGAALRLQRETSAAAWIFTSATLGDDDRLSWFTGPAALDDAKVLRLGSPFDYRAQARLWIPQGLPLPNDPRHAAAVAAVAAPLARTLGGRTFVLTTTLRALAAVADALEAAFATDPRPLAVLAQGRLPKRELLRRFLEDGHAVLVGSQSFWEGVDIKGEALQCVVIDKLPFAPPDDPLVEARSRRLKLAGRQPFAEIHVAEAAVSLKQGAGRLIRSEADHGILVICDPRLRTMSYGRRLIAALPPMTRVDVADEALQFAASIREPGTGERP